MFNFSVFISSYFGWTYGHVRKKCEMGGYGKEEGSQGEVIINQPSSLSLNTFHLSSQRLLEEEIG